MEVLLPFRSDKTPQFAKFGTCNPFSFRPEDLGSKGHSNYIWDILDSVPEWSIMCSSNSGEFDDHNNM